MGIAQNEVHQPGTNQETRPTSVPEREGATPTLQEIHTRTEAAAAADDREATEGERQGQPSTSESPYRWRRRKEKGGGGVVVAAS